MPRRTRFVRAATAARRVSGSWRGRAVMESPIHTESKPRASARSAMVRSGPVSWRPDITANSKIKKTADRVVPLIKLVENPDVLASIAQGAKRPRLVIGFAAETDDVVENAVAKRARKGADWIIANDVSGDVMGGTRNRVHLITGEGVEDWPEADKDEVARRLVERIASALA